MGYAAFLYWNNSQGERIFTAFFEPAPDPYITYRSAGEEEHIPEELKQALEYYNERAFTQSLPHFENYLQNHKDDPRALLLAANALLQAGRAARAEAYLLQMEEGAVAFQPQADWYLALAFIRQGKMQRAREKLESIRSDEASPFQEKAGEVLEKINGAGR